MGKVGCAPARSPLQMFQKPTQAARATRAAPAVAENGAVQVKPEGKDLMHEFILVCCHV